MSVADRLGQMSPEQRARLALRLSEAKQSSGPDASLFAQVVPDPDHRLEPFPLTDIQGAYLIGRGPDVELGNVACDVYFEVDMAHWDHQRFEAALQAVIARHPMMRCVVLADGQQQILEEVPAYQVPSLDLRGEEEAVAAERLEEVRQRMSHQVRPSDQWPLFDIRVSRLDGERIRLHVYMDLLIADAHSLDILFSELALLYRNPDAQLTPIELTFRDYVRAADNLEDSDLYRTSQEYWLKRMADLPPAPELPLARNPGTITQPRVVRRHASLDAAAWGRLKKRATQAGLTSPGILLAAFAEVLSVWSKNPQFTLNLTLFNRLPLHKEANQIVGDFTSVSLLEVDNSQAKTFEARAKSQQEQLWRDLDHRYFSGIRVLRELGRVQGTGPKAMMPVVFTSVLNVGAGEHGKIWGSHLGPVVNGVNKTPQVYLDVLVHDDGDALSLNWDAVDEVFPPGLLDDMFTGYKALLEQLASDETAWQRPLDEVARLLLPEYQREARREANDTAEPVSDELLHNLFLGQVEARSDELALSCPDRKMSYGELYRRAVVVEDELLRRGVKPNELVAVLMNKGWEQAVAVLGIHFAGAAYLPIDAQWPAERQRYIIEHGQARVVLTQVGAVDDSTIPEGVETLAVDLMDPSDVAEVPAPRRRQGPEDLAYVIFTSGSTGKPKGVMIDHRGAMNTILDINRRFEVGPHDRVLALSRLSFDLSVYDIFGLLGAGGTVVFPEADRLQDVSHWADLVASQQVTIWNTVPALMQLLVEQDGPTGHLGESALRVIMMSGDWIPVGLPGQIKRALPDATVMSLGGATEASIWSILFPIEEVDPEWPSVPYGKPMTNQRFHVLDRFLGPCPVWVPGDLYIGGVGLAKGYWRDPEKTDASFITHPHTGERLYRTGDLGRYLPDGNIEFLGREDFQVKVQGYRIELGEIEVRLHEHPGVAECVVVVREDEPGAKRLVAYVVAKPDAELESNDVRDHLRDRLPSYMVPTAFVFLDTYPLTSNGKVDRNALPAPARKSIGTPAGTAVPSDALEQQLTKLWETFLRVRPIGVDDNFFDLGGHSMAAVRLVSELRRLTGRNLALATLFEAPTVAQLAHLLRNEGWTPSWSSLVPIQPGGSKAPFYCVHAAGGNVLTFEGLARHLGPDYPVYGLQARGLDGSGDHLTRIEDMAKAYLEEIRDLQPEGPYYLGGFCTGGHVAFEMAQQLRSEGQEVALVALFDTYNFNGAGLGKSLRERITNAKDLARFHWTNIRSVEMKHKRAYVRYKLSVAWGYGRSLLTTKARNFSRRLSSGKAESNAARSLRAVNIDASYSYKPETYPGRLTLFNPAQNYAYATEPRMGWADIAQGGIDVIDLTMSPGGLFIEPYVQTVAGELRESLEQAGA